MTRSSGSGDVIRNVWLTLRRWLVAAGLLAAPYSATPARAFDVLLTPQPMDEAAFVFGGMMISHASNPFDGFEGNYFIGGGYQRLWGSPDGFRFGGEVGLAGRFGQATTLEAWGGIVGRYDVRVLDTVRVGASLTFGLSAVTGTQPGREQWSEDLYGGDATLLFYLAPEINLSLVDQPDKEVFVRLHHRSGAWTTLGGMAGASDALVGGLRVHF